MIELTSRRSVNAELAAALQLSKHRPVVFRRMENISVIGQPVQKAYFVLSGWACCHWCLADGRRQILEFLLQDDTISFLPLMMSAVERPPNVWAGRLRSSCTVTALTPVKAIAIDPEMIATAVEKYPEFFLGVSCRIAINTFDLAARRFAAIGQGSARERLAVLWLELWQRQRALGLADEGGFPFPISQPTVADALGLTSVHISRTLRWFEKEGILFPSREAPKRVRVRDPERLWQIAANFSGKWNSLGFV